MANSESFNPDEYLKQKEDSSGFDPDAYLSKNVVPGKIESFTRGAAQGASLGFADEITGALETLSDVGLGDKKISEAMDLYKKHRDESRENYKKAAAANPKTSLAGTLAGGLALPVSAGIGLARGAALGATTALGESENPMSVEGLAGIGGGALIGGVGGKIAQAFTPKAVKSFANEQAIKALNITPTMESKLNRYGINKDQVANFLFDKGIIKAGASSDDMEKAVAALQSRYGEDLGNIIKDYDQGVVGTAQKQMKLGVKETPASVETGSVPYKKLEQITSEPTVEQGAMPFIKKESVALPPIRTEGGKFASGGRDIATTQGETKYKIFKPGTTETVPVDAENSYKIFKPGKTEFVPQWETVASGKRGVPKSELMEGIDNILGSLSASPLSIDQKEADSIRSIFVGLEGTDTLSMSELQAIKNRLGKMANWDKKEADREIKQLYGFVKGKMEETIEKAVPEMDRSPQMFSQLGDYKDIKKGFQITKALEKPMHYAAGKETMQPNLGLKDIATGALAGGGGLASIPLAVGSKLLRKYGRTTAATVADKMAKNMQNIQRENPRLYGVISNAMQRGEKSFAATDFILSQTDQEYQQLKQKYSDMEDRGQ